MFRHAHLERRLAAILDVTRDRSPLGPSGARKCSALAAAALVMLAIVTPSRVMPGPLASNPKHAAPLQEPDRVAPRVQIRIAPPPEAQPPEQSPEPLPALLVAEYKQRLRLAELEAARAGHAAQAQRLLDPRQVAIDPPSVQMIPIPNWEVGRKATQLIPNYRAGMSRIVLVGDDASAQIAATLPGTTATVPGVLTSVD